MLAKNIDIFVKGTVKLFNEDKLPKLQISLETGELMTKVMFQEFKRAIEHPYGYNVQLNHFATFKLRYKHLLSKISDIVDKLKYYRNIRNILLSMSIGSDVDDISPYSKKYSIQNHYEKLLEEEVKLMKEFKVLWQIKNSYMAAYTKTAKYKRLQALGRKKQEQDVIIFLTKEEQMAGKRMTPKTHKVWNLDFD